MDIPRTNHDLGHFVATAGKIGRVQTLTTIPIVAGDTMSIDANIALRLTALRLPMVLDAKVDIYGCYVKHRNVYGDAWTKMVQDGVNGTDTLPSYTIDNVSDRPLEYLAGNGRQDSIPKHYIEGYNMCWNQFNRIPNISSPYDHSYVIGKDHSMTSYHPADGYNGGTQNGTITQKEFYDYLVGTYGTSIFDGMHNKYEGSTTSSSKVLQDDLDKFGYSYLKDYDATNYMPKMMENEREFGRRVARLPKDWNTALPDYNYNSPDYGTVSTLGFTFDLLDVAQARMSIASEIERDWFTNRYRDFISNTFGAKGISIDADDRPELLFHDAGYMSGYEIDSTDGTGETSGKSATMLNVKMMPKFFNEHGMLWLFCIVRFPSIVNQHKHYLNRSNLDYKQIMGDPAVLNNMPPIEYSVSDVFSGITDTNQNSEKLGFRSYGDWFRWQPDAIHNRFHDFQIFANADNTGYPFLNANKIDFASQMEIAYDATENDNEDVYDQYFTGYRLGHWNAISRVNVLAKRIIPPATSSIKAPLK